MSLAILAGTAGALVTVAAAAALWRESMRRESSFRTAYRAFAVAALLWGAGFVAQEAMPVSDAGTSLTFGDLLALLALPAVGVGLYALSRASREASADGPPAPGTPARSAVVWLADACLLATALFVIDWVALFGSQYHRIGESPGDFTLQAIHPLADLIVLGLLLAAAVRAGRAAVAPYLALVVVTLGDSLAVGARIGSMPPGVGAVLALLAGFCLLGAAALPSAGRRVVPARRPDWLESAGRPGATLAASGAAALAAVVVLVWALNGGSFAEPAVVVCGAVAGLALAVRITDLLRRERTAAALSEESEHRFRELADRTSDVVLICDRDGIIRYASPAVGEYGYTSAELEGRSLSELVHPEDRAAGVRVVRAVGAGRHPDRFPCRVRSADGTWRHVESTVSRYREMNTSGRLLITARDVSDQVALRRQVTYLTYHDGLTGLPNRAYVEDRARDAIDRAAAAEPDRPAAQTGAVFIDLDGFTGVNDSVGHGAGDLLLAQAARRLRAAVPPEDTVARWGGDEFAVLVESAASAPEIVDIAERLAGVIAAEPFHVADREISLTASIGVALPGGGAPGHLLRNADVAMSRAKESGGGRVEVFAAHMHADVMRRLEMASDLRAAITAGKLELEYQPVVEFATSRVIGVEALVRWSRGGRPVAPAEFLGVAEDSGLVVPLGEQVLREACAQTAAWRRAGWEVGVSVNFSLRQVTAAGFAASVLTALHETGLPPDALTLEVAERVLIEGADPMAERLAELRRHGVRLAIDDFGTGYASLAYLKQLAVDIIKIDPSFVAGLGEDATLAMLTRAIIQVGHDLGIEVVAEGIERPEHLELLREMGCGLGQGYLIAKPMDARGIEALVSGGWPGAGTRAGAGVKTGDGGDRGDQTGHGGADGAGRAGGDGGPETGHDAVAGAGSAGSPGPPSGPALGRGEAAEPAAPAAAPAK
ncbi:MAG TPA: EAL domain-containing protein [Streptosporangiaceae bacterium]|nr:EAL domain-containing protein [Streptosporangiaceae bacterium]